MVHVRRTDFNVTTISASTPAGDAMGTTTVEMIPMRKTAHLHRKFFSVYEIYASYKFCNGDC